MYLLELNTYIIQLLGNTVASIEYLENSSIDAVNSMYHLMELW